tara:strand:+ start:469 stop:1146 length:678 start_codon:yes stop_codon:yes gene_type:complete
MLKLGTIDEFKTYVNEGKGFAKANLYYVKFPTIQGINPYQMGLLTASIDLPSRQLETIDRKIGISAQKVVYGYVNPNVTMTFNVLNDQRVRKYFESWQQYILPTYDEDGEGRLEARFPDQYVAPIHIYQLERGKSFPLFSKQFDKRVGPFNINIDLDIDIGTEPQATYHWFLDRAYPVSITNTALSDGDNGLSTTTIEFQYKNWKARTVEAGKSDASIIFNGKKL